MGCLGNGKERERERDIDKGGEPSQKWREKKRKFFKNIIEKRMRLRELECKKALAFIDVYVCVLFYYTTTKSHKMC